jgi:hypothetical protein
MVIPADALQRHPEWLSLAQFAAVSSRFPLALQQADLDAVSLNFQSNAQRIKWMLLTPILIGDLTIDIQRCFDYAEFRVTETVLDPFYMTRDHPRHDEIATVASAIYQQIAREKFEARGTPEFGAYVQASIMRGTQPVAMVHSGPAGIGLDAILSSAITGTWTAFETMAGDLWEAALNVHPGTLSALNGRRKRLLSDADKEDDTEGERAERRDEDSAKYVRLGQIQRHQFDLRSKMGTVLRGNRRFDHLAGIREAYALAFSKKHEDIDSCLMNPILDGLNAVRNVIVHRSGRADITYERKCRGLPIPQCREGEAVALDPRTIRDLMVRIIVCSNTLLSAVDDWIATH